MGILDVLDRIFVKKNFNLYSVSRLDDLFNRKIVDIDKIVEYIEKKYSENSNCVDLFSKLAYYFLQKDDLYSAKKYLDKDSKLKRQSWWSTIRYAEYFALKGNINKSFEIIDKIYEENCEAMNGYGHVGWILYRKGKISYIDVCDILKKDIDKNRLSNGFKIIAASIFGINNLFFAQELVWEAYREDDFLKDGFSLLALNLMRNKDYALALFGRNRGSKRASRKSL
ncbi:MAG: hypothetical protein XD41_1556 [Desulfonauticus sp. 38_4375]|nr:MAG: hypothetical protein XD41_1556 [Desulfonauticus sp. 38_4375]